MVASGIALLLVGCSPLSSTAPTARPETDTDLLNRYFAAFNQAADQGSEAQFAFLRTTQHPDFAARLCELDGLTVDIYPAMSSVRPDPDWAPDGASSPRGTVYVVGVSLTVRRDGTLVGEQIGSQRVAILDRRTYGFAPCLNPR
ncbi:hypothetical protein SAMN05216266_101191 [Amycolatopsis marina]|uniref:Lipoprotein n=2 Tax=Amycolatopsis marina TaxID=490629 RepID=A0A1I0VDV3_9PSEU|nr:hypothetical protein SAMN05216266_101191 [Amycolatopsis marina]